MFTEWLKFMGLVVLAVVASIVVVFLVVAYMKDKEKQRKKCDEEERATEKQQQQEQIRKKKKQDKIVKLNNDWETELNALGTNDEQKDVYCQLCNRRQWQLPEENKTMDECRRNVVESVARLSAFPIQDVGPMIKVLEKLRKDARKTLEQGFDRLLEMPGIENIQLRNDWLVVRTDPIELPHDGETRYLGRFEIKIQNGYGISLVPVDSKNKNDVIHPSIKGSIILMKPSLRLSVARKLAKYQVADVVEVLLDFLKTYDPKLAFIKL